jgi:hypothetical protein
MRLEVVSVVTIKITVFWDVILCSLVYRNLVTPPSGCTSEMLIPTYHITRCPNPEVCNLKAKAMPHS